MDYELAEELNVVYQIEPQPTLLFFRDGMLIDRLGGLINRQTIVESINKLLS